MTDRFKDQPTHRCIGVKAALCGILALAGTACVASRPAPQGAAPAAPVAQGKAAPVREDVVLSGVAQQGHVMLGQAPSGARSVSLDGMDLPLTADGRFLIAFDRDAKDSATLRLTLADGRTIDRTLPVKPGNWQIEAVDASLTAGLPSAEFQRRRAGELDQINAARAGMRPESSDGWRQTFIWPVVARISGKFGAQRIYRGTPASYHSGVDLAAGAGTVYVAPADGVVILAADSPFTLEGNLLMIDHGMGLNSAFLHSSKLLVKVGEVVRRGQPIGIVGATGRATGPHLHWGMKWNAARIDPVPLVGAGDMGRP